MNLRLGYYRNDALRRTFRMAGTGGYEKTTGVLRKRINAMLWNYWAKPAPA
jgi:hypothetical protein